MNIWNLVRFLASAPFVRRTKTARTGWPDRTEPLLPDGLGYVEGLTHCYIRHRMAAAVTRPRSQERLPTT